MNELDELLWPKSAVVRSEPGILLIRTPLIGSTVGWMGRANGVSISFVTGKQDLEVAIEPVSEHPNYGVRLVASDGRTLSEYVIHD